MPYQIRKAAVLGAGVMGAAIAAHLANVGIPSLLLVRVDNDVHALDANYRYGAFVKSVTRRLHPLGLPPGRPLVV